MIYLGCPNSKYRFERIIKYLKKKKKMPTGFLPLLSFPCKFIQNLGTPERGFLSPRVIT